MWIVDNQTAYACERNWVRDKLGLHHWLVALRATFDLGTNGELTLADDQDAPLLAPMYHGEPGLSSMALDSDLLAIKPCTDVVIDAIAYAPRGQPAPTVPVSLRIGTISKSLLVHGDRIYAKHAVGDVRMTSPQPFDARAIRYENAYGGQDLSDPKSPAHDPRNPIGTGFARKSDLLAGRPAPNIEYTKGGVADVGPAGFGPIDRGWSPRRELAGTYDLGWEGAKKPLLPDDYDDLFASSAPKDQRTADYLQGGERVELMNLTPSGLVRFELPRIRLDFTTSFGSRRAEQESRLVTVALAPGSMRLSLIWQSSLMVDACDLDYLDKTVVRERVAR